MKRLAIISSGFALAGAALALSSAAPAAAQVSIRQYQEQAAPTPYPNAAGDSDVGPFQVPPSEFLTPEQGQPTAAPALPSAPSVVLPRRASS
jgi:hypothetical protein